MKNYVSDLSEHDQIRIFGGVYAQANSQLFLGLVNIIEPNDVRMVDELHDGNLALNASMHGGLVGQ